MKLFHFAPGAWYRIPILLVLGFVMGHWARTIALPLVFMSLVCFVWIVFDYWRRRR
jgi:hypothetical protein